MAAIYQRARPITFAQVIGQEHVKTPLQAALSRGRVGHAYLFSGPRGVGKTTTARLLAMAVNCEQGEKPCGECESCLLVRRGSHPDVTELDAASNNSVDDIRDLREKVYLSSIRGGRRVWILDEAHMLSKSASNALLKTLEEPPEGLVFVLATTEPEKLPPTILSRTQHFRFRRLSEGEIAGKLGTLSAEAGVEAAPEALALVARAADGAMRDAESLLERLLATGAAITLRDTESALGLPPQTRVQALARSLADGDLAGLLGEAGALYRDGFAPRTLAERLILELRSALYTLVGLETGPDGGFSLPLDETALLRTIHALDDEMDRFVRYDDLFSLEVALIKAGNVLAYNVPRAPQAAAQAISQTASQAEGTERPAPQAPPPTKKALPDFDPTGRAAPVRPPPLTAAATPAAAPPSEPPPPAQSSPERPKASWHTVQTRAGTQLKAFMLPAKADIEGSDIFLRFAEKNKFHFTQLKNRQDELSALVRDVLGEGYTLHLEGPGERVTKKP